MHIAFDVQPLLSSSKSGVGYNEQELIKSLLKEHPEEEYYFECFSWKGKADILEQYKTEAIRIRVCRWFSGRIYRFLSAFFPIPYSCFFSGKREITHFFNYYIPPFVKGKKVVTIHDMAFRVCPETVRKKTRLFLKLVLKKSIRRADKIITVSEFSKQEIIRFYGVAAERIAVIPNGVDLERFSPCYKKDAVEKVKQKYRINGKKYFLFLGNLEPRKNLVRLIQAYQIFLQRCSREQEELPLLVIAGGKGWMYQEIFKEVRKNRLEEKVIFTGYVAESDVAVLMAGADLFCFPSLYEGFGMPVLEAMACKTPVLTSDGSALGEMVGDAGIKVDAFSAAAIAEGMEKIHYSEEFRSILSEKGQKRVQQFSWKTASEELHRVYLELKERK